MEVQSYLTNAVTPGGPQAKRLDALVSEFSELISERAKQMSEQLKFLARAVYEFELPSPPVECCVNSCPKLLDGEEVFDILLNGSLIDGDNNKVSKRKLVRLVNYGYTNKHLSDTIKRLAGRTIVFGDTLLRLSATAGYINVIGKARVLDDGSCALLACNEVGYITSRIKLAAASVQNELKSRDYHFICYTYIAKDKTLVKVNVSLADWQYARRATDPNRL